MTSARDLVVAIDRRVSLRLADLRRSWLSAAMQMITWLGSANVCFPLYGLGLLFGRSAWDTVIAILLIAEALLFPLIVILRYACRRERPSAHRRRAWAPWNRYSFPSYHTARAWLLASILTAGAPQLQAGMLLLALWISLSRLYLQKHYLSDVLAGATLGLLAGVAAKKLAEHLILAH